MNSCICFSSPGYGHGLIDHLAIDLGHGELTEGELVLDGEELLRCEPLVSVPHPCVMSPLYHRLRPKVVVTCVGKDQPRGLGAAPAVEISEFDVRHCNVTG